jgi:hypothetical protein
MSNRFSAMNWCLVFSAIGLIACQQSSAASPCAGRQPDNLPIDVGSRLFSYDIDNPMPDRAALATPSLDDTPQPFVPAHQADEADRDRVEALSLFAARRTHEQPEEYAAALRCYERALRFDPDAAVIVPAILPLALRLKRFDEAVRYMLLPGKLRGADPRQVSVFR